MLTTSQTIQKYGLNTKKSLGQNFILDSNLTDKIARSAGDLNGFEVIEVGPGPGGLTRSILKCNPKRLIAIETDIRCVEALQELKQEYVSQLEIINADALTINEADFTKSPLKAKLPFKVIANLPYNVATPLLFKWLENISNFASLTLLFQKEVAERIAAKPNSKQYGRLSVMVQFLCEVKHHFNIPPSAFVPAPKVTSSLISLYPRSKPILNADYSTMEKVCKAAFGQRRKTLKSSLKSLVQNSDELLKKCNIDSMKRAEQLTVEEFCILANTITKKIDKKSE